MSVPADNQEPRRRAIVRRSRAAALRGSGTRPNDGVTMRGSEHEPDEIDDLVDPEYEANNRARPPTLPRAPIPAPAAQSDDGVDDVLGTTPAARLAAISGSMPSEVVQEYRMGLVQRLLMRRIPLDRIAQSLGISVSTVQRDKRALAARMRENAQALNIDQIIGEQMEFYSEMTAQAVRMVDQNSGSQALPAPIRLAAMRTAMVAQADKVKFLHSSGFLEAVRFRQSQTGGTLSDAQVLMQMTRELLNNVEAEEQPVEGGGDDEGFGSFRDSDSEAAQEHVEL